MSRAVARLCSLPLILFFVGYNVRGENACPSVPLLPHGFDLLLIVFVGGIAIGVGFLIFLGASKVFEFYTEDYADTMSLAVFLISLAVSVYFAEPIRAVIPINLLLLLILVHIVYMLIRWYVKGCMRSRGYY